MKMYQPCPRREAVELLAHVPRPLLGRGQQPGLVELPGPHLSQHTLRKRFLRNLELRRPHASREWSRPGPPGRSVRPGQRTAASPPRPRSTEGSYTATPGRRGRFESAREESRFAWRRASALPARFAGAPPARGRRYAVSCRHGSPSSTMTAQAAGMPVSPGSHRISGCASRRRRRAAGSTGWRAPGATGGKLASPKPVGRRHRQADLRIESDGRDPGDSVAAGIMGLRPGRRR